MKRIVVAIPHSHTFFWTQTCVSSLIKNPPKADGFEVEVVVVDNSPWSPALRGITETSLMDLAGEAGVSLAVVRNHKSNKFHASALDCIVEDFDFDFLMALETDVLALRPTWLQWFVDQLRETDFACGHWHHEAFINPSCTLYRGSVLKAMQDWCKNRPEPETLRWGPLFGLSQPIADRQPERDYKDWYDHQIEWICGPFADKRGWPAGTELKEEPSGQKKGPGWYEPGQMLHHWAVQQGYTYTVCDTRTHHVKDGLPCHTIYGQDGWPNRELTLEEMTTGVDGREGGQTVHMWGGTRALDIIKHEVTCNFVASNTPYWLEREARFWLATVPQDVREQTLELIRKHGWHYKGAGTQDVTERDRAAVRMIQECYAKGGVVI